MITLPLRGREAELAVVVALMNGLQGGCGGVVLVEGWPGIGKSRFLAEAGQLGLDAGMLLAAGRADEIEAIAPLAPLLSALSSGERPVLERQRLRALERPGDQRFWLVEELAELLELRSRETPLLISLDDLQWADPTTIWAVQALSQRLLSSPVGWLLAVRPGPMPSGLPRLMSELTVAGASRIELGPLSVPETEALAGSLLGARPDSQLRSFLAGAGGNPFLSLELLQALLAEGSISVTDGVASVVMQRVPERFRASVRGRLVTLSIAARQFLQAGSVFGRSFSVTDVATVLGSWPGVLVPVVDEALQANVLTDSGARLEFCHDLIRQAITEDMAGSTRVALHRAAAAAVLARGGPPSEAAPHLMAAAEPGDQEAVTVLRQAAAEIAGQAPHAAAELSLRAIDLADPGQPGWTEALVGTVRLAAWASMFSDAAALAQRALDLELDADAEATVRLGLADALLLSGRRREVVAQCRQALARCDFPPALRCHFLHDLGFSLAMEGEVTAAEAAYREALECAGPNDVALLIATRIVLAYLEGCRGHLTRWLTMAEQAARAAQAAGPEARQRFPQPSLASVLAVMDRFEDADSVFADYRREAEEFGASWALEFCQRCVAYVRMMAGRLSDAAIEAEAALALIDAFDMWQDSDVPLGVLALVSFHRNDLEAAHGFVSRSAQCTTVRAHSPPRYLDVAEALLREAEGDFRGAVQVLQGTFDRPEVLTQNLSVDATLAPRLVRLAERAGDTARAAAVVDSADGLARLNPTVAVVVGSAAHSRGLRTGDRGQLVEAAELFRNSPRLMARASVFEDTGQALVSSGDREGGVLYLVDALDVYKDAGAVRDESRVRRRLRRAGVKHRQSQLRPTRASFGWESITSAELRVVSLAAQGLTNRQIGERLFLSTYTVATHLKHVFDKVGVSSRVELTRLAITHVSAV
jgi:DNA-binding CsgD family transcriptional regulator